MKTIHTRPLMLVFSTPLVLYGARLPLRFAGSFWEQMKTNSFLKQVWVQGEADSLGFVETQIEEHILIVTG